MIILLFLTLCLAVFPVQLWLCLSGKKLCVKLIPVFLVVIFLIGSFLLAVSARWFGMAEDVALVGVILVMVGIFLTAAVGFAWASWAVVHFIQKSGK